MDKRFGADFEDELFFGSLSCVVALAICATRIATVFLRFSTNITSIQMIRTDANIKIQPGERKKSNQFRMKSFPKRNLILPMMITRSLFIDVNTFCRINATTISVA